MLSNAAFNALLKTLEEPPQNVKFIFATTEIKKIPATIISRCQKFDLQRVDLKTLSNHLKNICQNENISFENDSISHICKASEGSVRDALSLLDQAASLCGDDIKEQIVLNMLGLNGYEKNIELFELCLSNQCSEALKVYDDILQNGVQPLQIISNLLEISHLASKINVIKSDTNMTESIQKKISEISTNGLPKLVRLWQILIKSFEELKYAPNEEQAGSMAIIKLCYGSSLPDPSQFLEKISEQTNTQSENKQTKVSETTNSKEKTIKENTTNYKEEKSNNDQIWFGYANYPDFLGSSDFVICTYNIYSHFGERQFEYQINATVRHEAAHAAQFCKGGNYHLGVDSRKFSGYPNERVYGAYSIYRDKSYNEQVMELEAFALESEPYLVSRYLDLFCF